MKYLQIVIAKNRQHVFQTMSIICIVFFLSTTNSFGQMKVGLNPTNIDPSSMLEVEANNQGILLPRILMKDANVWGLAGSTPIAGMFIFNIFTNPLGGYGPGIYFWNNSKWNYVQNGAVVNNNWSLNGNSGTFPGTYSMPDISFIGTSDNVDFAMRTGNVERIRIASTGQIGINQNFSTTQQLAVTTGLSGNTAIVGQNTSNSGTDIGIGVLGTTLQSMGNGVKGTNSNAAGVAILGQNTSNSGTNIGIGVLGTTLQSLGNGVKGTNSNAGGIAVLGQNTAVAGNTGSGIGVKGVTAQAFNAFGQSNGYGVVAENTNVLGTGLFAVGNGMSMITQITGIVGLYGGGAVMVGKKAGGYGYSEDPAGFGLYGLNSGTGGYGLYGESNGLNGRGVYGYSNNNASFQIGVMGEYSSGFGTGVAGLGSGGSLPLPPYLQYMGVYGSSEQYGVRGVGVASYGVGIYGSSPNAAGTGVLGTGNNTIPFLLPGGQGGAFSGSSTGAYGYIPKAVLGGKAGTNYYAGSYGILGRADYYYAADNTTPVYQFGVYGEKLMTSTSQLGSDKRSGGVLGSVYDLSNSKLAVWSSLGYKSSSSANGSWYAAYGTSINYVFGAGLTEDHSNTGFGLGMYGGLMGGWVRGNVYGMNIKGERYGLYIDGYSYSNKPSVQLIENGGADRIIAYNMTSLSADVYAHGKGKLMNGKAEVNFDPAFQQIVDENDIAVTVTPIGESNGLHLMSYNGKFFSLQENRNADNTIGTSNSEFTWTAVGRRKDVKKSDIAKEVLDNNFDRNMESVMFNENDTTHSAGGMEMTKNGLKFYPVQKAEIPNDANKKDNYKMVLTGDLNTNKVTDKNNQAAPNKNK